MSTPPPDMLREGLAVLFRHARPALTILVSALLAASLTLAATPSEYTAEAKLVIRLGREKTSGALPRESNQTFMFAERAQNVNNEVEILRDPSVVRGEFQALKRLMPRAEPGPPPEAWGARLIHAGRAALAAARAAASGIAAVLRAPLEAAGLLRRADPDEALLAAYVTAFKVVFVKETDVIVTGFTWTDPAFAADALNRLLDAYKRRHVEVFADDAPAAFYAGRLERSQAELSGIDHELAAFLKGANTASFEIEQRNDLGTLSELERQRSSAQIEREGLVTRLARTRRLGPDVWQPTPPDADATVAALDGRRAQLRTRRADLATRFRPAAPEVTSLERDLVEVSRQKYRALAAADEARLALIDERIAALGSAEAGRRNAAIGQSDAALAYERLSQRRRLLTDEIGQTQRRIDALRTGSGLDSQAVTSASVVAPATPPTRPSGPNRGLILGLAAALGLLAALAYMALAEALAGTYRTPAELARGLGLPVLATLPPLHSASPS